MAASAMHGAPWVDHDVPIELIWRNGHPPAGLVIHNDTVADDEVEHIGRLPVTTRARTAFDLARRLPRDEAVARLDAVMWPRSIPTDDVLTLATRYPAARGLKSLRTALPLVDGGAASPRETWLRLILIDAGYPAPVTQVSVFDRDGLIGVVDMAWPELKIAVEYDGDHHRANRGRYVKDQRKLRRLQAQGWTVIRVIAEDRVTDILAWVADAWRRRSVPTLAAQA